MKKLLGIIVLVILLSLPWVLRLFQPMTILQVAVVDVTSTDEQLLERRGVFEALGVHKIVDANKDAYEANRDFYGVRVESTKENIVLRELPTRLDELDVLYLADMQGVMEKQLSWVDDNTSKLLYGGLSNNAWRSIANRLQQNKSITFIAEYNIFTTSTDKTVKQAIQQQLGIDYSGWQARHYQNLEDAQDVTGEAKSGSGLVLRNNETGEVLVLEDVPELVLTATESGNQQVGFSKSEKFTGWFDVAKATDAEILAHFTFKISDEQQGELEKHKLPSEFVAITKVQRGSSKNYYFAGNYSAVLKKPISIPYFAGYTTIQKWLAKEDSFYWKNYLSVMNAVLDEAKHTESDKIIPVSVEPTEENGLRYNARILGEKYEVYVDGKWQEITIKGVNIGMAKPGVFPGEAGITKQEYANWFEAIGELGSNSIRVYTIHPPGFYEALKEYNETHTNPLYVFHGVWVDEEPLEESLDVYGEPTENFQHEIESVIDIIHGNAEIEPRPGHASGSYTADISPYVIGWMLGIEWYPFAVDGTNQKYNGKDQHDGRFFSTQDAPPFEIWLAEQFEFTAGYEAEHYGWIRPFSFTNWVTTDLLDHPYEPSDQEDFASVDPNVIYVKNELEQVGQFAAYHVYPYYPDFLNYTPKYINYKDYRGDSNNYAAYLEDLHKAHRIPVLISEFGIPASRGLTHKNPFGWNQGFIAEDEQGDILVRLYEDILHEGMLGGLVFTWQDEWFKRTWNTMDLDNPDQRPFWSNAQTNEQQFGILSFDTLAIKVDGDTTDWFGKKPFYDDESMEMYVHSDERYLYIRIDTEDTTFSADYYPLIYIDSVEGQGNDRYGDIQLPVNSEFVATLKGNDNSRMEVDAYYDIYQYLYSYQLEVVPFEGTTDKNSGKFNPIEFALNKELTIPVLNKVLPFEKYETGLLRRGNGNPESAEYDSLADYEVNEKDGVVELRIPWLMLNVTDPSRLEVWSDLYGSEDMTKQNIVGLKTGVMLVKDGVVQQQLPTEAKQLQTYSWEKWALPESKERLKESYYILQKKFKEVE